MSVQGVRFELPSRYRQLERVTIRYASWDLSQVVLCDERSGTVLCRIYPVDKVKNADGRRRSLGAIAQADAATAAAAAAPAVGEAGMPPLLRRLVAEYAATGLPPAYLPKDENTADDVTSTDTTITDTSTEDI